MAGKLDSGQIGIPCPGCGYENSKTIGWIKAHNELTCGGCGRSVEIDSSNFCKGMREVDAVLDKLTKSLNKSFRFKL